MSWGNQFSRDKICLGSLIKQYSTCCSHYSKNPDKYKYVHVQVQEYIFISCNRNVISSYILNVLDSFVIKYRCYMLYVKWLFKIIKTL
jgi:hypothetical protein